MLLITARPCAICPTRSAPQPDSRPPRCSTTSPHLAPPRTAARGRPALKGPRLGTAKELAATAKFTTAQVRRYGRIETVHSAEIRCLWYGSLHTQIVRVILLREDATDTGYDLALVTTDPHASPAALITRYAWRWSIEVTLRRGSI